MRRLIVLAALLALVATACKIETNYGAVINEDGTATLVQEIGMDQEAQTNLMPEGTDPFEGQPLAELPGARTRSETRGDMTFWIIEADLASTDELKSQLLASGQEGLLTAFDVQITDTKITVTATGDTTNSLATESSGFDPAMFADALSANFKLTLPGRIGTNNADSVSGNTLTWSIPVTGGLVDIQAESTLGAAAGGGFPLWLIIVLGVIVLGAIGWFVMRSRKPAMAGGDVPPPPPAE
jgi:hypothetical protein